MLNSSEPYFPSAVGHSHQSRHYPQGASALQVTHHDQLYTLIDNLLPFEACLYHQVLPLSLDGSCLTIGIVDLSDRSAVAYVKQQLSYIHYSLRFEAIASDAHRDLLSKYLNYTSKQRQKERDQSATVGVNGYPNTTSQTLVLDDIDENVSTVDPLPVVSGLSQQAERLGHSDRDRDQTLPATSHPESLLAGKIVTPLTSTWSPAETATSRYPLQLTLHPHYCDIPLDCFRQLQPPAMMQALLSQVLDEGIGRLYFEQRSQFGRILWSRDGVLQAVVEALNRQVLQAVIYEFKRMMHLSLIPVSQAKQVEIERSYKGERLLLRFRVMPSSYGEEATLQVLRGAALRFYQQQQIDHIGHDALAAAQVLQTRLDEMRTRARNVLDSRPIQSKTWPQLIAKLQHMEAEIAELISTCESASVESDS
jgi:type II secretory ATPase GspE/PulE/Tfp pilus assembly ATPase PilB-like protein